MTSDPNKKIQQVGLTADSLAIVDDIADKVDKFNRSHGDVYVELDFMEVPPHEVTSTSGKYRMLFTFANRNAQKAFWLGNW